MSGQPPVIWDKAQGCQVYDRWGNKWLDWSSGVLVTNAGHNHPKIKQAMLDQINQGMVHCYCFPHEGRARLTKKLAEVAPEGTRQGLFADEPVRRRPNARSSWHGRRDESSAETKRSLSLPLKTPFTAGPWAPNWRVEFQG